MRPAFSTGALCLVTLIITAVGGAPGSTAAEELVRPAAAGEAAAFLSPDEKMQVTAKAKPRAGAPGMLDFTFTLEPVETDGKATVLELEAAGKKDLATVVKWSPDSRYVALMHGPGRRRHVTVYDCKGSKAAVVPLPFPVIATEVAGKLDQHVKHLDAGNPVPDMNHYVEGVKWTAQGRMVLTAAGFSLSPLEIGFEGAYEVEAVTGRPVCVAWEVHDLEDKRKPAK